MSTSNPTPIRPLRRFAAAAVFALAFAASVSAQPPAAPSEAEQAAQALLQQQDWSGAVSAFEKAIAAGGTTPGAHTGLATALHQLGRYDEALAALVQAEAAGAPAPVVAVRRTRAYLRLGRLDDAFASLDAAVKAGFAQLRLLDNDPELEPLRNDARFAAARAAVESNAKPCLRNPLYRKFDFWIGEWDVLPTGSVAGPTNPVSHSSIQLILDGCIIFENWTGATGYGGKSFNLWDARKERWQQTWVDNQGGILELYGQFHDDGNLYYEGTTAAPSGTGTVENRLVFLNLGPDEVRQVWEQSSDGGKTWTTAFDGTYRRQK